MKKLTPARAAELKAQGITHVASIIKLHYNTSYFKYETLETVLANGGKMPKYPRINGYVCGINGNYINWNHTIRWAKI